MKRIWAPWRIQLIRMKKPEGCFLCENPGRNDDAENYILYRGVTNFVVLNSYPYNPGHMMVAPYRHIADLEELSEEELKEHFEIVRKCVRVLRQEYNPEGFNIGINLREAAGSGIVGHIHTHIVPRWGGDTNFMPVLADARVLPEALAETYRRLKDRF